jgi:tetratricopeptide (TPR) repeat protein
MTRRQVDEGLELYAEKNYDAAIKKWTTALPKMKDNRLRFATLGYLASASRDRGRNKDYLVHAVQQIDIAHELDDNSLRAQAYLNLSRANEMLADYFKAISYSRSAMQYSPTGDSTQGYSLLVMADSYIGLCNFPKVLECLDQALSIAHENEDHLMEIQVLGTMGKVFLALKDFPKALAFQRRAHELALSNASYANEENANISSKFVRLTKLKLATPLRLMGDFDGATKCVEVSVMKSKNRVKRTTVDFHFMNVKDAMRAASSLGDRPVQAKCLVCIGDIKRSQNNNEVGKLS